MSERQLRELMQFASKFCTKVFARSGFVAPLWHAVKRDGQHFVELHPQQLGKDLAAILIRAQFDIADVVRYIYIGEAWTVDTRQTKSDQHGVMAAARAGRLHEHPDRVEIVQLQGEDHEAGQIMAQRRILRPRARQGPSRQP